MKIEKTNFGIRVIIPETEVSSEMVYNLRQVKVLNACCSRQHPIIDELAKREEKLTRKFLIRVFSMEKVFQYWNKTRKFKEWEEHNRMDFNEYFHDYLYQMRADINDISFEYARYCREAYPYRYGCIL